MALWDEQDAVEYEYARDSYSAIHRLSDLVELEQLLVPPPRIRARNQSWSPESTPEETVRDILATDGLPLTVCGFVCCCEYLTK